MESRKFFFLGSGIPLLFVPLLGLLIRNNRTKHCYSTDQICTQYCPQSQLADQILSPV